MYKLAVLMKLIVFYIRNSERQWISESCERWATAWCQCFSVQSTANNEQVWRPQQACLIAVH